jgi:hypothetical protein
LGIFIWIELLVLWEGQGMGSASSAHTLITFLGVADNEQAGRTGKEKEQATVDATYVADNGHCIFEDCIMKKYQEEI